MASSKARSRNRPAPGKGGRSAAGTGSGGTGSGGTGSGGKGPGAKSPGAARTVPTAPAASAASAVSTAPAARTRAKQAPPPEEPVLAPPSGPPLWLQLTSLVLAVIGLAISAYETYAHYNGSHLLGCSAKAGGTFDCTAVITSPTSMVFGVIPVALLGLLFYVFAVPIMTPWAWRSRSREIGLARLVSLVVGMAFVLYLIYAELYDIKQVCEYCTGVHIVTFLLFCITVFSAAIWGVGERGHFPAFPGRSRGARR